jgi:hypothetical protein
MAAKLRMLQDLGGRAQDESDLHRTAARLASSNPELASAYGVLMSHLESRERAASSDFVSALNRLVAGAAGLSRRRA